MSNMLSNPLDGGQTENVVSDSAENISGENAPENAKSPAMTRQSPAENAKYAKARRQAENEMAEQAKRMENTARMYGYQSFDQMEAMTAAGRGSEKDREMAEKQDDFESHYENDENSERDSGEANDEPQRDNSQVVRMKAHTDVIEFARRFPGVDLERLVNQDKGFEIFTKGRLGVLPLSELYADYLLFKKDAEADSESRRKRSTTAGKTAQGDSYGLNPAQLSELENWNSKNPHLKMSARDFAAR